MKTRNSKIGIVGGSGFVGSALAGHLSSWFDVKIIDIEKPATLKSNVAFAECDIRQYDQVEKVLCDVDLVIDTAIIQIPRINEQRRLAYEVNMLGTQNLCRAVDENSAIKGAILAGTWHVIGERELEGIVDEEFGFRPDKVEDRARLYAISKMMQETVFRYYDEMSDKVYGIIRMGTVLGEGMNDGTAASIFINSALKGKPITPFRHSMYRPMLYVDVKDVCKAFEAFARKILGGTVRKSENSLDHILNVCYPEPITVIELAETVRDVTVELTQGKIAPEIEIVDVGKKVLFTSEDKSGIRIDNDKALRILDLVFRHPKMTINELVKNRLAYV